MVYELVQLCRMVAAPFDNCHAQGIMSAVAMFHHLRSSEFVRICEQTDIRGGMAAQSC